MEKAAIYSRVSLDRDGDKATVDRQEKLCREEAERRGWEVVKVYSDRDASAFKKGSKRPGFESLMADAKAGGFSHLLIFKLDRLYRRTVEALRIKEELEEAGVKLHSLNDGDLDSGVVLAVTAAIAEQESKNISLRVTAAKRENAEKGIRAKGGIRPFGWDAEDQIIPEEAALIREAADRVLKGEGLHGICRDWESSGIKGSAGSPIGRQTLKRILLNPATAGLSDYKGQIVGKGQWEALLDEKTWKKVSKALGKRSEGAGYATEKYLLGPHILFCWNCGGGIIGTTMGDTGQAPRYRCQGCQKASCKVERLDEGVWKAITLALDENRLNALRERERGIERAGLEEAIADEIESLTARIEELSNDYYQEQAIPREIFLDQSKALNAQLEKQKKRLSESQADDALIELADGETLLDAADKPLPWRKKIVELAIDRIILHKSNAVGRAPFSMDRVEIVWRI